MVSPGQASTEGTRRYAKRLQAACSSDHFRPAGEWTVSSIGLGTYLGEPDEATDRLVEAAVEACLAGGINLVDCAINYRAQRAERAVGAAIARTIGSGKIARDELVVCTKGGFAPAPDCIDWFDKTYVHDPHFGLTHKDLVAGCHCLHPAYLTDQIERSLANLGLETIDVYYLHNPETQLGPLGEKRFYPRLGQAFGALEQARAAGRIQAYGLATWNALRVPADHPEHLDLGRAKRLAQEVAGGQDGLRFVQLPLNLAMPEALLATQPADGQSVPALEAARLAGLMVVTSASILQARLVGRVPKEMGLALGGNLTSDGQRALQFARSTPGVASALVGLKAPAHVREALALAAVEPLSPDAFLSVLGQAG